MEQKVQQGATRTLVCVTAQRTCERLIRMGAQVARGGELCVVHVAPMDSQFMDGDDDAQTLEFLYRIVREFNAEMTVERSDKPLDAIEVHARRVNAQVVVLGSSNLPGGREPIAMDLKLRMQDIRVLIVH